MTDCLAGVPHRCEETIEYQGVEIEKDTIVMSCEWSVLQLSILTNADS